MIKVEYTTECDHCKKQIHKNLQLDETTSRNCEKSEDGIISYFSDIWSPAIPNGWIQSHNEELGYPNMFCSEKCLDEWLIKNGRADEVPEGRRTWVA